MKFGATARAATTLGRSASLSAVSSTPAAWITPRIGGQASSSYACSAAFEVARVGDVDGQEMHRSTRRLRARGPPRCDVRRGCRQQSNATPHAAAAAAAEQHQPSHALRHHSRCQMQGRLRRGHRSPASAPSAGQGDGEAAGSSPSSAWSRSAKRRRRAGRPASSPSPRQTSAANCAARVRGVGGGVEIEQPAHKLGVLFGDDTTETPQRSPGRHGYARSRMRGRPLARPHVTIMSRGRCLPPSARRVTAATVTRVGQVLQVPIQDGDRRHCRCRCRSLQRLQLRPSRRSDGSTTRCARRRNAS